MTSLSRTVGSDTCSTPYSLRPIWTSGKLCRQVLSSKPSRSSVLSAVVLPRWVREPTIRLLTSQTGNQFPISGPICDKARWHGHGDKGTPERRRAHLQNGCPLCPRVCGLPKHVGFYDNRHRCHRRIIARLPRMDFSPGPPDLRWVQHIYAVRCVERRTIQEGAK